MKRRLAIGGAKWLSKRENREKVKRTFRKFKSRIEQQERLHETRSGDSGHESGKGRDDADESDSDRQSRR